MADWAADLIDEELSRRSSAYSALSLPELDPRSAALGGLAGDVVRGLEPHTEADPAALLVNFLTTFGAMVGPMAETQVGFAHHPPALFVGMVGRTSRSRKGTATTEIDGLMRHVEDGWHDRHRVSGFGSGEAFIEHASENPGDAIYMVEPELARLLAAASRDGSSVSSVLRNAWDFRRMEHRIRKVKHDAPAAPVSLVGHITIDELRDARHGLRPVEIMNGFGNRVLWMFVDRRRLLPDLVPVPDQVVNALVRRIRAALGQARTTNVLQRSDPAAGLWRRLYEEVAADDGTGVVDALTARAEAQLLRLSLIYALIDGADEIDRPHLESAWELWRYCRWSAQFVWVGPGTGDGDVDRVAEILAGGDDLTARELDRMFSGHRSTRDIREAAVRLGVAEVVTRQTGGRPSVVLTSPREEADKADKGRGWVRTRFMRPDDRVAIDPKVAAELEAPLTLPGREDEAQ